MKQNKYTMLFIDNGRVTIQRITASSATEADNHCMNTCNWDDYKLLYGHPPIHEMAPINLGGRADD